MYYKLQVPVSTNYRLLPRTLTPDRHSQPLSFFDLIRMWSSQVQSRRFHIYTCQHRHQSTKRYNKRLRISNKHKTIRDAANIIVANIGS